MEKHIKLKNIFASKTRHMKAGSLKTQAENFKAIEDCGQNISNKAETVKKHIKTINKMILNTDKISDESKNKKSLDQERKFVNDKLKPAILNLGLELGNLNTCLGNVPNLSGIQGNDVNTLLGTWFGNRYSTHSTAAVAADTTTTTEVHE